MFFLNIYDFCAVFFASRAGNLTSTLISPSKQSFIEFPRKAGYNLRLTFPHPS